LGYLLLFEILVGIPYFNRVTLMVCILIVQDSGIYYIINRDNGRQEVFGIDKKFMKLCYICYYKGRRF